jgi:hypothetical protein
MCTVSAEPLPDPKKVISGTDIPEWVSAAGRQLYDQASEIASQDFPGYEGPRIATYGDDNSKLTSQEQKGLGLLESGSDTYQSYVDDATAMAGTLGQGFSTQSFTGADTDALVGDRFASPSQFSYADFNPEMARQYQDVFQTSVDPALEELNRQRELRQTQNSADAIRAGAFGGSRLGLREATTDAEIARAGSDLRRQAGREGLQFASQRYDTDRMFDSNRYDTDRAFDASRFDAERAARFGAEDQRRAGFETNEAARQRAFETDEASRLRATQELQGFAPLVQGLTEQAASGLITAGQAQRELDQRALDMAYGDYLEQRNYPQEQLNFALGALQGVPYETRTIGLEQGQQYVQSPSIYGQTIGGLGSLASAYYLRNR